MRRWRAAALVIAAASAAACAAVLGLDDVRYAPLADSGAGDGGVPEAGSDADAAALVACEPSQRFVRTTLISDVIDQAAVASARLSLDERRLYLALQREDAGYDIEVSEAEGDAGFSFPTALAVLNGPVDDSTPSVLDGEREIYFLSARSSQSRLWGATRGSIDAAFGAPQLVAVVGELDNPYVLGSGTAGYANFSGELRRFDLDGGVRLASIISGLDEPNDPVVSEDERVLYVSARLSGARRIFVATRPSTRVQFVSLGPVDLPEGDGGADGGADADLDGGDDAGVQPPNVWPTWISRDGCRLYYVREAPGRLLWVASKR